MGERQGYLVYADNHQVQQSLETKGFSGFLNEMSVSRQEELLSAVTGAFQTGSSKKSYFFMDFNYRDYAALQRGLSYRLPVYGVKGGISGLTRATNYVQAMAAKEKELSGQNFNSTVFGADYLKSEEITAFSAGMLTEALNRSGRGISNSISAGAREKICCLTERIWHFQEINPRTRLVLLLHDAETKSCEILRQVYLLFPQKLRLQLGFETNIAREDLDAIANAGGLPIYILTMEKSEYRDLSGYSFPVEVVDYDTLNRGDCDSGRLNLLMALAKDMSEMNAGLFDHAEKKVIEGKEGNASSFKYYGEIVERMTSGDLFWWTNHNIGSVEQLKAMYDDQTYLMNVSELKAEAIRIFYTEIYPTSNLGQQVAAIATDKSYKNRQELLEFLSNELYLKPQIKAAQNLKDSLDKEKDGEMELLKEASRRQIRAERDKVAQEYEKQVSVAEEMAADNAERADKLKKELDVVRAELQTANENIAMLKNSSDDSKANSSHKKHESKANRELQKKADTFRIAAFSMGLLFVVAAVFAIINFMNAGNLKEQLASANALNKRSQAQIEEQANENRELQKQIEELTAEKDRLAEQKGAATQVEMETSGLVEAEQSEAEQAAAEQSEAEQAVAEQAATEQAAAEQTAAEQAAAEQAAAEQAVEQAAAEAAQATAGEGGY